MPVFFKAHRPLRPERKERNPVPLLTGLAIHATEQVSLRVNIIRALNLPHKIDSTTRFYSFGSITKCNSLFPTEIRKFNGPSVCWSFFPKIHRSNNSWKRYQSDMEPGTVSSSRVKNLFSKYFGFKNPIKIIEIHSFTEGIRSLAYLQSIRDDLFIQLFDEVKSK